MSYHWNYDYPQIARDSGFYLRQFKDGTPDWTILGSIDIDELVGKQNFEKIDNLMLSLAEVPLDAVLNSNVLESGVAKYIGLTQLAVQYMLFCRKFLDETVSNLRVTLQELQLENAKLKTVNSDNKNEIIQLHKKLQRIEEINEVLYPCSMCTKNFISNEMLNTHISRKHQSQKFNESKNKEINDRTLINTIKLELEVKQLKERLNAAEKTILEQNLKSVKGEKEDKPQQLIQMNSSSDFKNTQEKSSSPTKNEIKVDYTETGIQTSPLTESIGIQTNFIDEKEIDDIVDLENKRSSEILSMIQEQLGNFEEWKNQELQKNHNSIHEIKQTLNEIANNIGKNHLNSTAIQNIFKQIIEDFEETYTEKLNQTLKKIEISSKSKDLISLQDHQKKVDDSSSDKQQRKSEQGLSSAPSQKSQIPRAVKIFTVKSLKDELENKNTDQSTLVRSGTFTLEPSEVNVINRQIYKTVDTLQSETYSIEKNVSETTIESDDSRSLKSSLSNSPEELVKKSAVKENIQTNAFQKSSAQKDNPIKIKKASLPIKKKIDPINLFRKKLSILGITSKNNALSEKEMKEMFDKIAKEQSVKKKNYPNFFTIRNRLKTIAEDLANKKLRGKELPSSKIFIEKVLVHKNPENEAAAAAAASTSGTNKIDIYKINTPDQSDTIHSNQLEDFKSRLEKILSSPIKKPEITTSNTLFTSLQTSHQTSLKKPVPIPRKKVIFDLDSQQTDKEGSRSESPM